MLETSSQEIIYGDQFTISTQFIKPFYFVIPFPTPTDPAPKFLKKLTPFIQSVREFVRALQQANPLE